MIDLPRRLAAEALGTGLLVATVVGSGIMAERLTDDGALALLGNTLPTVAVLVVLISLFGPISGAHFNPAVSLVFALRRELSWRDFAAYAVAQVVGGILGTLLAHLMFELPVLQLSAHIRTGPAQWLSEGVATLGLVLTILIGIRHRPQAVPALVGLYIGAAYWFTASTSFANPAVAIARALTDTFSGIRPVDLLGFIPAQVAGAVLALGLAHWLLGQRKAGPA
jgi:glycerol uptake facilitator-like aquaporin